MKKRNLFAVIGIAAMVAAVFTTTSSIDRAPELTDLQKANLAALSDGPGGNDIIKGGDGDGDGGGGGSTSWSCWSQEKSGRGYWRCGSPCEWIKGAGGKGNAGMCYKN